MFRTFNCGIGLVIMVDDKDADDILQQFSALGEKAFLLGEIEARRKKDQPQVIIE